MKFCLLFFIPLVLWLSINPCCAGESIERDKLSLEESADTSGENENHAPCSPFYACGGCSGFVWQTDEISLPIFEQYFWKSEVSENLISIPLGIPNSIHRPPCTA